MGLLGKAGIFYFHTEYNPEFVLFLYLKQKQQQKRIQFWIENIETTLKLLRDWFNNICLELLLSFSWNYYYTQI